MGAARVFTPEEREYLVSLAAVDGVDGSSRIHYADWFRVECMRRYRAGARPTALFREAGLDPGLVGHKRIERAFARWRYLERTPPRAAANKPKPQPVSGRVPAPTAPDPRDELISTQARRIQQLEARLNELKRS